LAKYNRLEDDYKHERIGHAGMKSHLPLAGLIFYMTVVGCVVSGGTATGRDDSLDDPNVCRIDRREAQRLYSIMTPLLGATDRPKSPKEVKIGVIDTPDINAANAGGGVFYVTSGLLQKASDDQLRGVLAHEIAHEDLGHVAKLELLGTGVNLGVVLLEQLFPGSSALTPIAGNLITRGYSRSEEFAADRHGVEILRRAGYSKQVMIDALDWISRTGGGTGGGGFLSTHPATAERIQELRRMA
jgi:predicted Zn-dependent protease